VRLAEQHADPVVLFQALGHAASWRATQGGDWRELMDRADRLAPTIGHIPGVEHPDLQFARMLRDAGEFEEAHRRIDGLIDTASARGDWHSLPRLLSSKAGIHARTGDLQRSEAILQDAVTGVLQTGEGAWMDNVNVLAHWIAVVRGDIDRARAIERRAAERLAVNPLLAHERWSTVLGTAELEFARGDLAAADRALAPLLAILDEVQHKAAFVCETAVLAIEVAVGLGRMDRAEAIASAYLPRVRDSGVAWIEAQADRAEAVLLAAKGDIDRARARSDAAVEAARNTGMPMVHGRALLTAGEILRRARQKGQAREALSGAIDIFEKLGARLWLERSKSELSRVAVKRPEGAGLTATEQQVVALVAAGRSNKEIADSLFMSVHTVEAHLTRLFRALGVASRTELARLVLEGTDRRLAPADPDSREGSGVKT
jgi:DNA-binding CsgD family transcriptional regulator